MLCLTATYQAATAPTNLAPRHISKVRIQHGITDNILLAFKYYGNGTFVLFSFPRYEGTDCVFAKDSGAVGSLSSGARDDVMSGPWMWRGCKPAPTHENLHNWQPALPDSLCSDTSAKLRPIPVY